MPEAKARLFLAVPVPASATTALGDRLARLPDLPGRTVPAGNWHLTLRFLGPTERPLADRLVLELRRAALGPPFPLRFGGLGAFPAPARARVLWLGVAGGRDALHRLANTVAAAVLRAGAPADERPFAAHLTLARLRQPRDVRPLIERAGTLAVGFTVTEVVLFSSQPTGGPPRYDPLARFSLPDAELLDM